MVGGGQQTPGAFPAVCTWKLVAVLSGLSILSLQKTSASSCPQPSGPPQFPQVPSQYHWVMAEKSKRQVCASSGTAVEGPGGGSSSSPTSSMLLPQRWQSLSFRMSHMPGQQLSLSVHVM